jgi:hypothetical protein
LAELIFVVLFATVVTRFRHMKATLQAAATLLTMRMYRYLKPVAAVADNFKYLFEMPVLFFALVSLLPITRRWRSPGSSSVCAACTASSI